MTRGTGKTTRQMQSVPLDGIFIWCNHHLDYPRHLQQQIGRPDIKVVTPGWVMDRRWDGNVYSGVVLDHAFITLCPSKVYANFRYCYEHLQTRIRKHDARRA